jgi:hypothetical protein
MLFIATQVAMVHVGVVGADALLAWDEPLARRCLAQLSECIASELRAANGIGGGLAGSSCSAGVSGGFLVSSSGDTVGAGAGEHSHVYSVVFVLCSVGFSFLVSSCGDTVRPARDNIGAWNASRSERAASVCYGSAQGGSQLKIRVPSPVLTPQTHLVFGRCFLFGFAKRPYRTAMHQYHNTPSKSTGAHR